MEILATILTPNTGQIFFRNTDLLKHSEVIRSQLGYLPQQFGFYPNLTAVEFLDYILLFHQIHSPKERAQRIEDSLENVGLIEFKNQKLKTYSGGMIRRLGIAQAVINNPKLLIVDEPTAGLDPNERIRFRQLLGKLIQDDPERIVIISTHIINDITNVANQIVILKEGQFLYNGTPKEFIQLNQEKIRESTVDQDIAELVEIDMEEAYYAFMRGEFDENKSF